MKLGKTKWMRIALLMLPLVVMSALLMSASRQHRQMRDLFTSVPGTEGSTFLLGSMWRSSTEVVCLTAGGGSATLKEVDKRSGSQKRLPAPPANHPIYGNFGVMVSPDGRWVLWPGGMSGWNAMTLDGKRFVQRPRASTSLSNLKVAWLPDSSGWVEASEYGSNGRNGRPSLIVCSFKTPKVKVIEVPQASAINNFQVTRKGDAVLSCAEPVSVRFVTVPLASPTAVQEHEITPPFEVKNGQNIMGTLVSPRGDRIAWTFQTMKSNGTTESVWLSDINGKNFQRLTPELDKMTQAPIYLHWMPDGQNLSCWRQKSLWVLNTP